MPEVPKKRVPEEKKPAPPAKVEAPPAKGTSVVRRIARSIHLAFLSSHVLLTVSLLSLICLCVSQLSGQLSAAKFCFITSLENITCVHDVIVVV